jgi:hypothetical protein
MGLTTGIGEFITEGGQAWMYWVNRIAALALNLADASFIFT